MQRVMLQDFVPARPRHVRLMGRSSAAEPRAERAAADPRRALAATLPGSVGRRTSWPLEALVYLTVAPLPDANIAQSGLQRDGGAECPNPLSSSWRPPPPSSASPSASSRAASCPPTSVKHAEGYAQRLVAEARAKQKEIVLEGKDEALQAASRRRGRGARAARHLQRPERRLLDREEALDRKLAALERREAGFADAAARGSRRRRSAWRELQQRQLAELERVCGLTAAEARQALIRRSWTRRRPRRSIACARSSAMPPRRATSARAAS